MVPPCDVWRCISVKTRRRSDDYTPEPFTLGGTDKVHRALSRYNDSDQWTGMPVPTTSERCEPVVIWQLLPRAAGRWPTKGGRRRGRNPADLSGRQARAATEGKVRYPPEAVIGPGCWYESRSMLGLPAL
jgi:hypothetical protein